MLDTLIWGIKELSQNVGEQFSKNKSLVGNFTQE